MSFYNKEMEERVGFEPTIPRERDNGFQDRRFRPLSHLSSQSFQFMLILLFLQYIF